MIQMVETGGQVRKKEEHRVKPLKVMQEDHLNIERKDLISLQLEDITLEKCFKFAESGEKRKSGKNIVSWFEVKDGLLLRHYQSPAVQFGDIVTQIVLPKKLSNTGIYVTVIKRNENVGADYFSRSYNST